MPQVRYQFFCPTSGEALDRETQIVSGAHHHKRCLCHQKLCKSRCKTCDALLAYNHTRRHINENPGHQIYLEGVNLREQMKRKRQRERSMAEESASSATSQDEESFSDSEEGEEEVSPRQKKAAKLDFSNTTSSDLSRMVQYMNDLIKLHLSGFITESEYQRFKSLIRPQQNGENLQTLFSIIKECLNDSTDGKARWKKEGTEQFQTLLSTIK